MSKERRRELSAAGMKPLPRIVADVRSVRRVLNGRLFEPRAIAAAFGEVANEVILWNPQEKDLVKLASEGLRDTTVTTQHRPQALPEPILQLLAPRHGAYSIPMYSTT
jgi:hypothetical protein